MVRLVRDLMKKRQEMSCIVCDRRSVMIMMVMMMMMVSRIVYCDSCGLSLSLSLPPSLPPSIFNHLLLLLDCPFMNNNNNDNSIS